jgi:hypothetical protein
VQVWAIPVSAVFQRLQICIDDVTAGAGEASDPARASNIELQGMRSRHPIYVEGRNRMLETLHQLGMP